MDEFLCSIPDDWEYLTIPPEAVIAEIMPLVYRTQYSYGTPAMNTRSGMQRPPVRLWRLEQPAITAELRTLLQAVIQSGHAVAFKSKDR